MTITKELSAFFQRLLNFIKRFLGILLMITAPAAIYFLISEAIKANDKALAKIAAAATDAARTSASFAKTNTNLQWGIIVTIFIPVMVGLFIFGYYGVKGEYGHLPENSKEI